MKKDIFLVQVSKPITRFPLTAQAVSMACDWFSSVLKKKSAFICVKFSMFYFVVFAYFFLLFMLYSIYFIFLRLFSLILFLFNNLGGGVVLRLSLI